MDVELQALATQADLPAHLLSRLLRHAGARRAAALLRRDLTVEQMEEIIALGSARPLAANTRVPAALKARLAEHPEPDVRCAAAASATDEPPGLLARLAEDPDPLVRSFLTMNDHLPAQVLARLAEDPDAGVREWIPRHNLDAPDTVRRALFTDAEACVRQAALAAWPPPGDLLPALLADPATRVAAARRATPTPDLARDPDPRVRGAVAAHPELPTVLRDLLAEDRDLFVRNEIALRADTTPELKARIGPTLTPENPTDAALLAGRNHACPPRSPAPPALTPEQAEALLTRAGL